MFCNCYWQLPSHPHCWKMDDFIPFSSPSIVIISLVLHLHMNRDEKRQAETGKERVLVGRDKMMKEN